MIARAASAAGAAAWLLVLTCPAAAEERRHAGGEIAALLAGKTVVGTDAKGHRWTQIFQKGGRYCSQWPPAGGWDCFNMTGEGDRATFVSSNGATYPVEVLP